MESGTIIMTTAHWAMPSRPPKIFCEASPDGDIPDKTKGGSGAVFILDFGPIYKTMCVAPIDSAQRNPLQVCENILA